MERRDYNRGRDDLSQSGRPHTYTARSHEDLIKSHLTLDGARKAKLQNEVDRLAAENDGLRADLDNALRDNQNKDNEIIFLNDKLREKPETPSFTPSPARRPIPLYEIDGKQLSVDEVIDHFNVILQRHHDLINHKNQQIQELQNALDNQPIPKDIPKRDAFVQPLNQDINQKMLDDFSKQMELIRKEYEQAENKLINRNNKLEKMIDDLQNKLEGYQNEINLLRTELAREPLATKPSKSCEQLLQEKEKEINNLRDLINKLKKPNDDNNDLVKLIENKNITIVRVNKMVNDIELAKDPGNLDLREVENDCKIMIGDLNNMNDRLNNILNKLKDSPQNLGDGEPLDKKDLISNLENIKDQCREEIKVLENKIHPKLQKSGSNITSRLDTAPSHHSQHPYGSLSDRSVPISYKQPYTPKTYPITPCEACSTPYLPQDQDKKVVVQPSWIIPEVTSSRDPSRKAPSVREKSPIPSENKLINEFRVQPQTPSQTPKKEKSGCCGKKGSDTSNEPYNKNDAKPKRKSLGLSPWRKPSHHRKSSPERKPSEERVMQVHEANRERIPRDRSPYEKSPREKSPRERSPLYKIGLGSRMGKDYHYSIFR